MKPGLFADFEGLLAVARGDDGGVLAIRVPLSPEEMEGAATRILEAARALRRAQPAGERPRLAALRRNALSN
jgi:hypothetical protein